MGKGEEMDNLIVDLRRKQREAAERARTINALRGERELTEDETRDLAGAMAEITRIGGAIESEEALDVVAVRAQPVNVQAPMVNSKTKLGDDETKAVAYYVRTADASALTNRAYNNTDMNIGTAADGGYTVPTGLYNQVVARRDEGLLQVGVRRIPGKGLTVRVPVDGEADVLFTSVAEANSIGQDAPALGYKDLTLVKYAKYITLSWELMRDEDANLMSFIGDWIGRGVAATHNSLLITEALASGTAGLTLDAAAAIGVAEIPELVGKLAPEYQDGAQWIIHPTTVAYLQGLTGSSFYFAPLPSGYGGKPSLWGFPVNQSSYATALAASAKSLIFGNFSYMGMRQGTEMTMLRDPYTGAGSGQVKLWFWFDAVYGVLQAEAIQYATHPSA